MTTSKDLKIGKTLVMQTVQYGHVVESGNHKITNVTEKNVMYLKGESTRFQHNNMTIDRCSIKNVLEMLNQTIEVSDDIQHQWFLK